MSRFFIEIKYDGTNYHGWQIQKNANSVQAEINKALSTILQTKILLTGAGRTDAGVHAKQLFAHFDTEIKIDSEKIIFKLNRLLPSDVSCSSLIKVKDDAHARFSAIDRTYEYWIATTKDPFLTNRAYFFPYSLNINLMNKASKELLNHIDFSCFSKSNTDTFTNNCKISKASWENKDDCYVFTITADRFLRNMVRAIVGTMLDIGQQKIESSDLTKIINSKNRNEAGRSVPPEGLYLIRVNYPKEVLNG